MQSRGRDIITRAQDTVEFSCFTSDDIRKLSVVKVCSPLTFDALGYPLPGGLYDKLMGPLSDRSEPCGTCQKNVYQCPGHFGHIELTLPVLNNLYVKFVVFVLKLTCFKCSKIRLPGHVKHLLSIQMRLLNMGLIIEPLEIESKLERLVTERRALENISEEELLPILSDYEVMIEQLKTEGNTDNRPVFNKNTEGIRKELVDSLFKKLKSRTVCMHCKEQMGKIVKIRNKIIQVSSGRGQKESQQKYLNPEEIRRRLRALYKNEKEFLHQLAPVLKTIENENPTDIFFFEVIPVPPINVRPVNFVNGRVNESKQSNIYKAILHDCSLVRTVVQVLKNRGNVDELHETAKAVYLAARGATVLEKLNLAWDALQADAGALVDAAGAGAHLADAVGLKQLIEKKAGVIRRHMMGKRVNFAGRSVITPDPNIGVDEVGVPEEFALKLTYPVPVTAFNVEALRKLVMNGPDVYPGAVMVEFEDGTLNRINPKNKVQQQALTKRLLTPDDGHEGFKGFKTVHRHLRTGDVVLLNRQPTLHRPSIMAHRVRILSPGGNLSASSRATTSTTTTRPPERTLRLHYSNCKAYNADFDGDEMNLHFPQNEFARTEAYQLVNVANHFLVPKDGTPLGGLIQDHVIAAVRMTVRGRFFDRYDYQKLVFAAVGVNCSRDVRLLPPAVLKPRRLWSGKQVVSTVLVNVLPADARGLVNLRSTSKIPSKLWRRRDDAGITEKSYGGEMSEADVVIRQGELLVGVLDKTHIGATPFGLGHSVYELYGGTYTTRLLTCFGRLFTSFLQTDGFTLGVKDILVTREADARRSRIVAESRGVGRKAVADALRVPEATPIPELVERLEEAEASNPSFRNVLDRSYKSVLDRFNNEVNRAILPDGLITRFPDNNLQLMVQSGAKGSTVNTMQISCLLGQIELEGRRPPAMVSGRRLPSFPVFEFSPRAGGFIDGRFMTGIGPQEFFFHCMAGREGLIDTAVKTSRSGYLQRCLIKPLEGVTVAYDLTVRDSDKSVIQFLYGEDGLDISKSQFFNEKQLKFLADNTKAIYNKEMIKASKDVDRYDDMIEHESKLEQWIEDFGDPLKVKQPSAFSAFSASVDQKTGSKKDSRLSKTLLGRTKKAKYICDLWAEADVDVKESFKGRYERAPDPTNSVYQPDLYFGSLNERLQSLMQKGVNNGKHGNSERKAKKEARHFEEAFKLKAMQSVCQPGEPVGLLAAQSIGEPSTQMTLNTFHFAGRGEMNVTLGIPRLREILMTASKAIKTPTMRVPFREGVAPAQAERLKRVLTRVTVADVLEKIDVSYGLVIEKPRCHRYTLRFQFVPYYLYKDEYAVKPRTVMKHVVRKFFAQLFAAVRRIARARDQPLILKDGLKPGKPKNPDAEAEDEDEETADSKPGAGKSRPGDDEPEEDSSDEEPEDADDAKSDLKRRQRHDESDEENENEDEDSDDEIENGKAAEGDDEPEDDESDKNFVMAANKLISDYAYDRKEHEWCELTFTLPLSSKKHIDMSAILRDCADKSVIHEVPNIRRAFVSEKPTPTLVTDGINIVHIFRYSELLDLDRLYSNDIHKVAETYGIEAAVRVITREIQDVFKVYGITVDPRHLNLIADYMTTSGQFVPFSRKGMESSASPLQQMSFEASLEFLRGATLGGKRDQLTSPSSSLMVGKPCTVGTGIMGTLYQFFPSKPQGV